MKYALCVGLSIVCFMDSNEALVTALDIDSPAFKQAGYQVCRVEGDDLIPVSYSEL